MGKKGSEMTAMGDSFSVKIRGFEGLEGSGRAGFMRTIFERSEGGVRSDLPGGGGGFWRARMVSSVWLITPS